MLITNIFLFSRQCFFSRVVRITLELCGKGLTLYKKKVLDCSELKAFADVKLKMRKMGEFFLDKVENILRKGENAGYHHFFLFPTMF